MSRSVETPDRVVVKVPMTFRIRGGRRCIILPEGERPRSDGPPSHPLLTALARAHRWQRLMEDGTFASLTELADSLGVQRTYVARVMNLTGLAPEIVERMLAGNEPDGATLRILHAEIPVDWAEQAERLREQERVGRSVRQEPAEP